MKKSSLAIVVIAALIVAYPAASWVTGKRLEAKLTEEYKKTETQPGIRIVSQSYERGIFSSVQKGTMEFVVAPLGQTAEENLQMRKAMGMNGLQLSYVNKIVHGPIPGIFGIAAGKVETEFVMDPTTMAGLKKVFGDKKYLEITTILKYTGGGTLKLSSPALTTTVGVRQDQLEWKGLNAALDFNEAYTQFKMHFIAPGVEVKSATGDIFKMGEMTLNGNAERLSPEHTLYTGQTTMSIDSVSASTMAAGVNNQVEVTDIKMQNNTALKNDLYSSGLTFGVGKLNINSNEFSNVHFDYSLNNLHAPSIEGLMKEVKSGMAMKNDVSADVTNKWLTFLKEMVKHKPEFVLDKMSIAGKSGEMTMKGKLNFDVISDEDFQSAPMLLSKLMGQLESSFSEDFIFELMRASVKNPDMFAQSKATLEMQIKAFEAQGYLKRNGKILSSTLDWKNSAVQINGIPFPPANDASAMADEDVDYEAVETVEAAEAAAAAAKSVH